HFTPHPPYGFGRGADKDQPGVGAGLRKAGILSQEPVAGMDSIGAGAAGRPEGWVDRQGGGGARGGGDAHGLGAGGHGLWAARTASSAARTNGACRSASEYTATVPMPIARPVRITRRAISPRLATRILRIVGMRSHPKDTVGVGSLHHVAIGRAERDAQHGA